LRPGDISFEIDQWLTEAMAPSLPNDAEPDALAKYKAFSERREKIKSEIIKLRERVTHFNLPYLSLPASTAKDIALQVFINMNTNSKPLSLYDIIVAEVEGVAQESLHSRASNLQTKCPHASRYGDVTDLILSTSALLQDQLPNNRGMIEMDKQILLDNWPKLERGLEKMAAFLSEQGIFDQARLPTSAVLPVIAAAYDAIPDDGDFLAKAEKLLRRYVWSAFFTDRYENTAASRAYADFKAIKALLIRRNYVDTDLTSVPVLNRTENPLADADSLMSAGWPKGVGIEARGILGVSTYFGALDFADEKKASYESIQNREYHHLFPDALLSEVGINSNLALNCALITWKTNRVIGRKDPLVYLQERIDFADTETMTARLSTHLIPHHRLASAHYDGQFGEQLKECLEMDFREFLRDRARLMVGAISALASGEKPALESVIKSVQAAAANAM